MSTPYQLRSVYIYRFRQQCGSGKHPTYKDRRLPILPQFFVHLIEMDWEPSKASPPLGPDRERSVMVAVESLHESSVEAVSVVEVLEAVVELVTPEEEAPQKR